MATIETTTPGKRERNKADKLRRIVGAARDLFEANGFEATTTAQISERAGVGTGTLYLYFDSKEDLLVEVFTADVGQAWQRSFDEVDAADPLLEQLLQVFTDMSRFHMHDPGLARAYFRELSFIPLGSKGQAMAVMQQNYERISHLLATAQERDQFRADVPLLVLSRNLFAIWYDLMRRALTELLDPSEVRARLEQAFTVALMGLVPDS